MGRASCLRFRSHRNLRSTSCKGGETSFAAATIKPKTGLALFFIHHFRHKGQPVTRGRKYVLRTDVMYRLKTDSSS